jgi:hypothetical protein
VGVGVDRCTWRVGAIFMQRKHGVCSRVTVSQTGAVP